MEAVPTSLGHTNMTKNATMFTLLDLDQEPTSNCFAAWVCLSPCSDRP